MALACSNTNLKAQTVHGQPDIWLFWHNNYKFAEKWSLQTEVHMRFDDYFRYKEQFLFRPSVTFQPAKQVSYSLGYTYIHTFPYGQYPLAADRPEHNIWEQVQFKQTLNKVTLTHRLRLEQRFQSSFDTEQNKFDFTEIQYSNRFRYRISIKVPITDKLSFHAFDELWIRSTNKIKDISFDRNWFYAGLGYQFTPAVGIQLGYLHQYAKNNATLFEQHHTMQLTIKTVIGKPKPKTTTS